MRSRFPAAFRAFRQPRPALGREAAGPETAIAWLTHFHDPEGQAAFARLADEAAAIGPVIQFRDGFSQRSDDPPYEIVPLGEEEIAAAAPTRYREWRSLAQAGNYGGGLTDILLLAAVARLSQYPFVWLIEADVDFTGDWRRFFEAFRDDEADLLGTNLYPFDRSRDWFHWRWFRGPEAARKDWTRGFFPVARLSRRFVDAYLDEVRQEWSGHYEALWPTIARHRKLKVADIGGRGPLVPRSRRGRWYTATDNPALDSGTFRFRPAVADRYFPLNAGQLPPDHLCHPVKTAAWRAQAGSDAPRRQGGRAIAGGLPREEP